MRGVIYAHAGTACLTRLIVSLHSLRKHWVGPTTVFQDGIAEPELKAICADLKVDLVEYKSIDCNKYTKKCHVNTLTKYDANMLLDADTIVVDKLDPFFKWVEDHGLVFTNFCNWKPTGGTMSKRIRSWTSLYPEAVETALNYPVALNTGVYGFQKDHPFLEGWLKTSIEGGKAGVPLTDELAAQLLAQFFPHYVAPPEWNYSVRYGEELQPLKEAKVIHLHGRKHVGDNACQKLWRKEFDEANKRWGLKWWGDKRVKKIMGGKAAEFKLPFDSAPVQEPKPEPSPEPEPKPEVEQVAAAEVTFVTAVDEKYLPKLEQYYPQWKSNAGFAGQPLIVYYHGIKEEQLQFLENARLIPWDVSFEANQRERMLSAFVLGAAKDVETPYWVKCDADLHFANPLETPFWNPWVENGYQVVGHRWGYTKVKGDPKYDGTHWLNTLDAWWKEKTGEDGVYPPIEGARYSHPRINSFLSMYATEFTRKVAELCGDRLPVPSQDTVVWYVAERLDVARHRDNMKKLGAKQ